MECTVHFRNSGFFEVFLFYGKEDLKFPRTFLRKCMISPTMKMELLFTPPDSHAICWYMYAMYAVTKIQQLGTVLNKLDAQQSNIFKQFPPKGSFKLCKNIKCLVKNANRI